MRPRRVSAAVGAVFLFTLPAFAGYRIAAWIPGWDPNALTSTQTHAGLMSESNPTWYNFNADGTLAKKTAAEDPTWRAAMTGTALLPTIQNTTASGWNQTVALNVLNSAANREAHAEAIRQLVAAQNYDGVDIDYERLPLSVQANFSAFIQLLAQKLHADGRKLSVTVYAKTSDSETWDGAGGEDYAAIGAAADWVKLMAYDYSYSTSAPGPITPLTWLDQVMAYTSTKMPLAKVMVGLPWYGYDWPSKGAAADLTYPTATSTAQTNAATITHDTNGEATFKYSTHTAYFNDSYAHDQKVNLILQKYAGVAGFAYWYIGSEDPAIWTRVQALFAPVVAPSNPPAAPTALTSAPTSASTINLSWADNSSDESGFSVESCAGAGCTTFTKLAQLGANATSYSAAGLASNTTYAFRVRAYNAAGNSAYSNNSESTTTTLVLPPANAVSGNTLVAAGATWRYLDNGSNQGTAWRATSFNDASWATGAAELGYGDGDEKTVVSYGPSSSAKYTTTFFRYSFDLADPPVYGSLNLRLIRDDGAVVYLNGVEIFRSNMPTGTIAYDTFALPASDDGKTWFTSSVPVSALIAGRNTVAVEVHQDAANSSDISFNFELTGTQPPPAAPSGLQAVATSQTAINLDWLDNSPNETGFYVERCAGAAATCTAFTQIAQLGANATTYAASGLTASTTYTFRVRAYSSDGNSAYSAVASAATLAPPPPPNAPSGLTATATSSSAINLAWLDNSSDESGFYVESCGGAGCTNFAQIAQVAANVSVYSATGLAANTAFTFRVRAFNTNGNSAYSAVASATTLAPPPPPPVTTSTLVSFGSVWKYLDNGSDQGTAWRALSFNDAAWKSGPGQLGYGDGDEKTVVSYGPSGSAKYITTYFRQTINVPNPAAFTSLLLRLIRDDGAVVYINGTEVWRSNMPTGTITYKTLSATGVAGTDESKIWETTVPSTPLVAGTNVIAVEIHQNLGNSSDISFDMEIVGK